MTVIIPALRDDSNRYSYLQPYYNYPGLISINSKYVISHVIDFYLKYKCDSISVAIRAEDLNIYEEELSKYKGAIEWILIDKNTFGVNETLREAFNQINSDDIIVNPAQTIPTSLPTVNSFLLSHQEKANDTFSVYCTKRASFFFKNNLQEKGIGFPFTGVVRTDMFHLKNALESLTSEKLNDLAFLVEKMIQIQKTNLVSTLKAEFTEWIDIGHQVNYFQSKPQLLQSRYFNSFKYFEEGIIRKTSKNIEKAKKEFAFSQMLPENLKIYFPRILHTSFSEEEAIIDMEYYGYTSLAELFLYRDFDTTVWQKIFCQLHNILTSFQAHPFSIGERSFIEFYFRKTQIRIDEFLFSLDKDEDVAFFEDSITINGIKCRNFQYLRQDILTKIESLYNEEDFLIMHGDFCFNNILYDYQSHIIKLIDPRGSFGEKCVGVYGDQKYDLAKLAHSSIGMYDFIVNDLYSFSHSHQSDSFEYAFPHRRINALLASETEKIVKHFGYNLDDIMFLVALLFLSMCPLHADDLDRQKVMYIHGIFLLNKYL